MSETKGLRRRDMLGALGAIAVSGLVAGRKARTANPAGLDPPEAGQPRVLALIGDRYHNSDFIRVALDRVFRELNLPVTYTINYGEISADLLRNYRLFVVFRDGMIWPGGYLGPDSYSTYSAGLENPQDWSEEKPEGWITEEQGKAIHDFVRAGNALYALHNSTHISLYSKHYREVMGGAYIDHPALRPFKVRVVNPDHPITRGVQDFIVNDEQHYMTYDKDPQHILLRSENIDGLVMGNLGTQAIAGWAYDYGQGRVVYTAPGHTLHALWAPEYLKIQKNAVRWLLKMT